MTLSYGVNYPMNGRIAKSHLNKFLIYAKREFGAFDYFWVLEFQKRGAVHFHIACTLPEPNIFERQRFADIWTSISQVGDWGYTQVEFFELSHCYGDLLETKQACYVQHVHPKAWERVRSDDGMGRYLAKYANKLEQKLVPVWYRNVGRFWGVSSGVKLPEPRSGSCDEKLARFVSVLKGRDTKRWKVLPKIILTG